jgi:hypothetical protein
MATCVHGGFGRRTKLSGSPKLQLLTICHSPTRILSVTTRRKPLARRLEYKGNSKKALDRAIPLELNTQYPTHRTGGCGELVACDVWSRSIYGSENDIAGSIIVTWGEPESLVRLPKPLCTHVAIGGGWGCYEFVTANKIIPIKRLEPAPNPYQLSGF